MEGGRSEAIVRAPPRRELGSATSTPPTRTSGGLRSESDHWATRSNPRPNRTIVTYDENFGFIRRARICLPVTFGIPGSVGGQKCRLPPRGGRRRPDGWIFDRSVRRNAHVRGARVPIRTFRTNGRCRCRAAPRQGPTPGGPTRGRIGDRRTGGVVPGHEALWATPSRWSPAEESVCPATA